MAEGFTVVVAVHERGARLYTTATTYGVEHGRYASLGRVMVELTDVVLPKDKAELARFLLWSLYGADYDL